MEINDINEKVKQCFENIGILIESGDNFALEEYIVDSITYMSFLVELEQMFSITIPDEYLQKGRLQNRQSIVTMVDDLLTIG
jgi:acyl carrier protein